MATATNSARDINFWVSDDLIKWSKYSDVKPDLTNVLDYPHPLQRIGAPKMFYDKATSQYLVSIEWEYRRGDNPDDGAARFSARMAA